MAKFILGLLVGVMIGMLSSSYFAGTSLNDLTISARAVAAKHLPVNN